jgi:hypothetical protein
MWFESDKAYYEAIVKTHKGGDTFDIMWVKEGQEEPMELKESDQTEDVANEDRWNVVEPVYRVCSPVLSSSSSSVVGYCYSFDLFIYSYSFNLPFSLLFISSLFNLTGRRTRKAARRYQRRTMETTTRTTPRPSRRATMTRFLINNLDWHACSIS